MNGKIDHTATLLRELMLLFSHSVMSNSLQPHGLQHTRLPCPSPPHGAWPNSHPFSWWCHPTILSSIIPVSSCPQSFPAPGSFPKSRFFASGGQNIRASAKHQFRSVPFSHSVMYDSLPPHGLQHTRPPCPSPTPRLYSNSCPLSRWCHPTISSSVVPFSSCLHSFPVSGSFPMSQLFTSGGQSEFQLQYQSFQWIFRNDFL